MKLDIQIRNLHHEMSDEPATMQYRHSNEDYWRDVANHVKKLNGNIVDESGTIVSYGRGNSPGICHVDDVAYFDSSAPQQTIPGQLRGEESLSKVIQIDEDLALKAMAENTHYVKTPVDPKVAQFVDPATIGYLPPLKDEEMDKLKGFVKLHQDIFVTGLQVVSDKPDVSMEIAFEPAEPGDPHVLSLGELQQTIKLTNNTFRWPDKLVAAKEESIYSDRDRIVFALEDTENRGGGIKGHCYQSLVSGRGIVERSVIQFQNGNPDVFGINGHTNETILSILIHRMEYLDSIFPSDENKEGLKHMKLAKEAFEARAKRLLEG